MLVEELHIKLKLRNSRVMLATMAGNTNKIEGKIWRIDQGR